MRREEVLESGLAFGQPQKINYFPPKNHPQPISSNTTTDDNDKEKKPPSKTGASTKEEKKDQLTQGNKDSKAAESTVEETKPEQSKTTGKGSLNDIKETLSGKRTGPGNTSTIQKISNSAQAVIHPTRKRKKNVGIQGYIPLLDDKDVKAIFAYKTIIASQINQNAVSSAEEKLAKIKKEKQEINLAKIEEFLKNYLLDELTKIKQEFEARVAETKNKQFKPETGSNTLLAILDEWIVICYLFQANYTDPLDTSTILDLLNTVIEAKKSEQPTEETDQLQLHQEQPQLHQALTGASQGSELK